MTSKKVCPLCHEENKLNKISNFDGVTEICRSCCELEYFGSEKVEKIKKSKTLGILNGKKEFCVYAYQFIFRKDI